MEQCYWILRHLRAWLYEHLCTIVTILLSVAVLFGVSQVSHLIFHLPSIKALWSSHPWLTLGFWTMVMAILTGYVILAAHVLPASPRGFVRWADRSLTRPWCIVSNVGLTVVAVAAWWSAPEDSLLETLAWGTALGVPIFHLLALLMRTIGEPILNLPWSLLSLLRPYWGAAAIGAGVGFLAILGLWQVPIQTQAWKGFLGIGAALCAWIAGGWLHALYGDEKRTRLLMRPIGRALGLLLVTNALGEALWWLAQLHPDVFSFRNYSVWCILHLLFSVVLLARVFDWWTAETWLPMRPIGLVIGLIIVTFVSGTADVGSLDSQEKAPTDLTEQWLDALHDRVVSRPTNRPVIIVAGSGGGSRAALFTALVFEMLAREPIDPNQREAGTLSDQIVLVSSVSGGSLASAYYATAFDRSQRTWQHSLTDEIKIWLPKKTREFAAKFDDPQNGEKDAKAKYFKALWDETEAACADLRAGKPRPDVEWILKSRFADDMCTDFMAPLVRGVLYPGKERGVSVTDFWENRFKGFMHSSDADWPKERPILVLNSAEVETGRRLALGFPALPPGFFARGQAMPPGNQTVPIDYYRFENHPLTLADRDPRCRLTLAEAVRASANFPYGFNPGLIRLSQPVMKFRDPRLLRVIDGGVLDNTGIDTLAALFESIEACERNERDVPAIQKKAKAVRDEIKRRGVLVLEIDSGASPGKPGALARIFSNLSDPFQAMGETGFVNFHNSKRTYVEEIHKGFLEEVSLADTKAPPLEFALCRFVQLHCNHSENVMTAWALSPSDKAAILVQFLFEQQQKRQFLLESLKRISADIDEMTRLRKTPEPERKLAAMKGLIDEQARFRTMENAVSFASAQSKAAIEGLRPEAQNALKKRVDPLQVPARTRLTPKYEIPATPKVGPSGLYDLLNKMNAPPKKDAGKKPAAK